MSLTSLPPVDVSGSLRAPHPLLLALVESWIFRISSVGLYDAEGEDQSVFDKLLAGVPTDDQCVAPEEAEAEVKDVEADLGW